MEWALIKDGIVENIIVADEEFINLIRDNYDDCICIDNESPRPNKNWIYDGLNFAPPNI